MHFSLCDPHNDSLQEETKMNLQGKRVLVFGTGKSGIGAADLLGETGAHVILFDGNEKTDKDAVLAKVSHAEDASVYSDREEIL